MQENKRNPWKIAWGLSGILFLALCALLVYGFMQLRNPSTPAVPPPSTTPLPSFSPAVMEATDIPAAAEQGDHIEAPASIPDPAAYSWQLAAEGLARPVGVVNAGDGSGRLFIIEQEGKIRMLQDGYLAAEPFLDISGQVTREGNEQGLLGLAFHPEYAQNGYFYVNYTDLNGHTVISRLRVSADANLADPSTELRLLQVNQPYANHNGGGMAFGPDGYLYLGLGDGGLAGDPQGNGQNTNSMLGKLLRIDVDGSDPYVVPSDNPFAAGGGAPEVWAMGLRNPWRFSFDPQSGDLYIGDVGQGEWEEIDYLHAGSPGGANFGWDYYEAYSEYEGTAPADVSFVEPVAAYPHSVGCSVTGGEVYRGASLPELQGVYLYGDYCSGSVWGLLRQADGSWQNQLMFQVQAQIASFGRDEAGELYLADLQGNVYKLVGK